jgi:hypothetical protein
MHKGSCHCGAVTLTLPFTPEIATQCNCSLCRRIGGPWAYFEYGTVGIAGHPENTSEYVQGDRTLRTIRCKTCGCVTHWEPLQPVVGARHGVHLGNFDPELIASVRVRRFDGANTWKFLDEYPSLAKGTFSVEMKPHAEPVTVDGVSLGRMSLDKRFEGDLVATGKGDMLTARTSTLGSAGYVAIERVTGTLQGRSGSFVFQHSGTMDQGAQRLSITVVPGSGTGALAGISGDFKIKVTDGKHYYEFEYLLP